MRISKIVFAWIAALTLAMAALAAAPTFANSVDWPNYNRTLDGHRYSALDQITPQNVATIHKICSIPMRERFPFHGGPVVIDGILYATTFHDTYAVDARTCALRWRNQHKAEGAEPWDTNRGVAVSGNRVIRGHQDGHLVALDRNTGKPLWDVAVTNGKIGEFLAAAPIVWNDTVFIGTAGSDWGVKGRMMAFDAATGKKKWSFTTIASGSDPNAKSWTTHSATGGGGSWTTYTLDPQAGEVFVPVANPAPDFASSYRPGANLYTDSLVVLDAATGKLKWYYQLTAHDNHDYDLAAAPVLYETEGGKPMVGLASKDGFIYGLDRTTHALAFKVRGTRLLNGDKPITASGTRFCPGALGGAEWNGSGFDEKNHLLVTPMNDWCMTVKLSQAAYKPGAFFMGGTYKFDPRPQAAGSLTAINADSGKVVWRYKAASPMLAGVTPTASGLIFTGDMDGNFLAFDALSGKVLLKRKAPSGSIAGGVVTYAVNDKQYVAITTGNASRFFWGNSGRPTIAIYAL